MDKSPLTRLPAEIRNRIYEYTFAGEIVFLQSYNKDDTTALTRTCRQVRKESLLMVFAEASLALASYTPWHFAETAPLESIAVKLNRVFDHNALAIIKDRDLLLQDFLGNIAPGRRIRLKDCEGCRTSGLSDGLSITERDDREFEGYDQRMKFEEKGLEAGAGTWHHANHTCWKY